MGLTILRLTGADMASKLADLHATLPPPPNIDQWGKPAWDPGEAGCGRALSLESERPRFKFSHIIFWAAGRSEPQSPHL